VVEEPLLWKKKVEYKDGKINGEINDRETVFVKEK
jgi:hypothetical protein